MKTLKEYISKILVSISEGKEVGYVLDCVFDEELKKLQGFVIVDCESEEELFLPAVKIKAQNEKYIFIDDSSDVEFFGGEERNNPIGKRVFDNQGNDFGRVVDCVLKPRFLVEKLLTDKCEIMQKNIVKNGSDFIFYGNKKRKNKKNNNIFEKYQKNSQKIQENIPKIKIQEKTNSEIKKPEIMFLSPKSLLNKIATCDVYGFNNELIIKKNQTIDENVIKKAQKHNKLNYLFFNSKAV